jgi:hypothetical protein
MPQTASAVLVATREELIPAKEKIASQSLSLRIRKKKQF